jgi:hypothetical protein
MESIDVRATLVVFKLKLKLIACAMQGTFTMMVAPWSMG